MKIFCALAIIFTSILSGQFVPNYSVAISDDATSQILNSAGLRKSQDFNMLLFVPVNLANLTATSTGFSVLYQNGGTGFGYTHFDDSVDLIHWGSGYHIWKGIYLGTTSHLSKDGFEATDYGLLYRGKSWFALGINWKNQWTRQRGGLRADQELRIGIAIRSTGDRLTFAYDHRVFYDPETLFGNGSDQGGIAQVRAEPIDGLTLFSSYNTKTRGFQIGVSIGFGKLGLQTYHNVVQDRKYTTSLVGFQLSQEIQKTAFRSNNSTLDK